MFDTKRLKPGLRFFLLGTCSTLVLAFLATALLFRYFHTGAWKPNLRSSRADTERHVGRVGPWGIVEASLIPLAHPDGVLPDQEKRLEQPKWCFENPSESRLARFFGACDLRPAQTRTLLDKRFWNVTSNACEISLSEAFIWSLNGQSRQQIYSVLAKSPANYPQRFPFRFSPEDFVPHLQARGLTVQNVERLARLTYTNGDSLCFTDLQVAKALLSANQFENLVAALYETPAYTLRLRVTPDADIDALVKYWGKGGREKRIKPLLKALNKVPGGASINVSYLLPPFARLRLYTYPDSWHDAIESRQDCFFTSMNFFNETPNTNLFDNAYAQKVLDGEYAAIDGDSTYGDLILLLDEGGKPIHMCVLIADDFVFTKNGVNPAQPWILMRMGDMLATYYGPEKSARMVILRRKDGSENEKTAQCPDRFRRAEPCPALNRVADAGVRRSAAKPAKPQPTRSANVLVRSRSA